MVNVAAPFWARLSLTFVIAAVEGTGSWLGSNGTTSAHAGRLLMLKTNWSPVFNARLLTTSIL